MDLVAGVRKEGSRLAIHINSDFAVLLTASSRGGRADFKWEDVKDDVHRENYLGHSIMAPVGRWQKNRDLSWYAKSDTSPAALSAAEARKEELRKIKEAEQDALSEALGYAPMPKRNANETPLGKKEVERAVKETAEGDGTEGVRGVGFGAFHGPRKGLGEMEKEVLGGLGVDEEAGLKTKSGVEGRSTEKRRRSRSRDKTRRRRRRSRSRDRSRDRGRKQHVNGNGRRHGRYRSHLRSKERLSYGRERSRSYDAGRDAGRSYDRIPDRSKSPDYHRRRRYSRDKYHMQRP
ncbi:MAG: hypothetical protein Q9163_002577 [Psora crenata]